MAFSMPMATGFCSPLEMIENSAQTPRRSNHTHPESDDTRLSVPVFARTITPPRRPFIVPCPGPGNDACRLAPHGRSSARASKRTIPVGETRFRYESPEESWAESGVPPSAAHVLIASAPLAMVPGPPRRSRPRRFPRAFHELELDVHV